MTDWLRVDDGHYVNMGHVTTITVPPHSAPGDPEQMSLHTRDGRVIELLGPACTAVRAYLDAGLQRVLETKGVGPPPSRPQRRY